MPHIKKCYIVYVKITVAVYVLRRVMLHSICLRFRYLLSSGRSSGQYQQACVCVVDKIQQRKWPGEGGAVPGQRCSPLSRGVWCRSHVPRWCSPPAQKMCSMGSWTATTQKPNCCISGCDKLLACSASHGACLSWVGLALASPAPSWPSQRAPLQVALPVSLVDSLAPKTNTWIFKFSHHEDDGMGPIDPANILADASVPCMAGAMWGWACLS